ncbi:mismatch-specific DNA-glycosylase [Brevibacterium sp. BRM-1]|uniref:mismatch-specific DNA-glycosylase n=1 Tax=Brevibacterium sp. BRM-1 TaxID=2999062 RepID=UPI00227E0260|nr:mismatch-specific DNA-glycosylase [Brevibacterium sp. BRM-1]WAL40411.1 mismatch-specific DNA-glycosylase [Brevibacterium sp. BRM-1]
MSPPAPLGPESGLPARWRPWRRPSPLGGARPTPAQLAAAAEGPVRDDVLPLPDDAQSAGRVRLLIVGINPSPWTTAVNAPFARPGNRFWPSLAAAGILPCTVDASRGLSPADERLLAERGIGIANLVGRTTARAAQLKPAELRAGGQRLARRTAVLRPGAVAIVGITAFRTAFDRPAAVLGRQPAAADDGVPWVPGWPHDVPLWALPNPSGLNAHETADTLAAKWREVWAATGGAPESGRG